MLADGGRITEHLVQDGSGRLRDQWTEPRNDALKDVLSNAAISELDAFDRLQLESVLEVCR